ncbi:LysR family transcriptional regulator [Pollutimonas nitritireducens]|uniref:LysR family transcriptional regulator n=1 Tax=Pollutimonas nitritireducens TaxID=2045209 RepID=A0A2N4UAW6_9BURK|nr:LysR substrate-binding domain-containing protein [Pollutimonas nitritireducens]PLC52153.1 LysR family transcriptional regulator [Pollutimonas nitritireducens]
MATTNIPRFDLVDLRLFVMVAESNSFTKGAEKVFLSVAAASLRIKSLEERLGVQLLYRNKRGVSSTRAGEVLLVHALRVLDEIEQLQNEIQPFSQGVRGHVRLFANATAICEFLPEVLARFFETNPAITVDLQERLSAEIVHAVLEGVADIGVISARVAADGLETLPYKKDQMVIVAPQNHPLAEVESVHFADALDYEFISLDSRSASYSYLQQEVELLGRAMHKRIQVSSYDAMCRMVEAGVGIGVLPEMAARRLARLSRIAIVQLRDEWATRELRICVRKQSELRTFARELIDFILQI